MEGRVNGRTSCLTRKFYVVTGTVEGRILGSFQEKTVDLLHPGDESHVFRE